MNLALWIASLFIDEAVPIRSTIFLKFEINSPVKGIKIGRTNMHCHFDRASFPTTKFMHLLKKWETIRSVSWGRVFVFVSQGLYRLCRTTCIIIVSASNASNFISGTSCRVVFAY